jgi:hypothetical protein
MTLKGQEIICLLVEVPTTTIPTEFQRPEWSAHQTYASSVGSPLIRLLFSSAIEELMAQMRALICPASFPRRFVLRDLPGVLKSSQMPPTVLQETLGPVQV